MNTTAIFWRREPNLPLVLPSQTSNNKMLKNTHLHFYLLTLPGPRQHNTLASSPGRQAMKLKTSLLILTVPLILLAIFRFRRLLPCPCYGRNERGSLSRDAEPTAHHQCWYTRNIVSIFFCYFWGRSGTSSFSSGSGGYLATAVARYGWMGPAAIAAVSVYHHAAVPLITTSPGPPFIAISLVHHHCGKVTGT